MVACYCLCCYCVVLFIRAFLLHFIRIKHNTVAWHIGKRTIQKKTYIAAAHLNRMKKTTEKNRNENIVYCMFRPLLLSPSSSWSSIYFPYLLLLCALLSHYSRVVYVSFVRPLLLPLHIFERNSAWVCVCVCRSTVVIRLFINVLLLIFQLKRIMHTNRACVSTVSSVQSERSKPAHLDGESHTHESRWWCVHNKIRRFQFRQWLWFLILFSRAFFFLCSPLLLFLVSSLHVHFHPSIRIHMSAHKWLYHFEWQQRGSDFPSF